MSEVSKVNVRDAKKALLEFYYPYVEGFMQTEMTFANNDCRRLFYLIASNRTLKEAAMITGYTEDQASTVFRTHYARFVEYCKKQIRMSHPTGKLLEDCGLSFKHMRSLKSAGLYTDAEVMNYVVQHNGLKIYDFNSQDKFTVASKLKISKEVMGKVTNSSKPEGSRDGYIIKTSQGYVSGYPRYFTADITEAQIFNEKFQVTLALDTPEYVKHKGKCKVLKVRMSIAILGEE